MKRRHTRIYQVQFVTLSGSHDSVRTGVVRYYVEHLPACEIPHPTSCGFLSGTNRSNRFGVQRQHLEYLRVWRKSNFSMASGTTLEQEDQEPSKPFLIPNNLLDIPPVVSIHTHYSRPNSRTNSYQHPPQKSSPRHNRTNANRFLQKATSLKPPQNNNNEKSPQRWNEEDR
jgi:hypothetical protein